MVPLTLVGNEGDGGEQKFSKVHGSRLGWPSVDVLTNCWRTAGHSLSCQLLSNFYQYPCVYRPGGIYHVVTAESTFYAVLIVVPSYTMRPHIQLSNIGAGWQCCDGYTELHS
jgi:hypothetical protein